MNPKRISVNLRRCAELIRAERTDQPWRARRLGDNAELAFNEATAGLPLCVVEELQGWSEFAAMIQLTGYFDRISERLVGLPIAKKLMRVLHRIGPDGRERLSREGVKA